jgi:cholesterol transport system auxiliary component
MNDIGRRWFSVCLLALLLGGCTTINRPYQQIDYYTLEYDAPGFSNLKTLPLVIRVGRFQAAPVYNTNRMIYRQRPFTRDAYVYHLWRANPGDLVSYFLARDFQHSLVFKAVVDQNAGLVSSHIVQGMVDEFYEHDGKDAWEAVLSVSITLTANNDQGNGQTILFQKSYGVRKACRQKNPRALAEAMSSAMASMSEMIITDIYHFLAGTL